MSAKKNDVGFKVDYDIEWLNGQVRSETERYQIITAEGNWVEVSYEDLLEYVGGVIELNRRMSGSQYIPN